MSINRSVSKSREVMYSVEDNGVEQFTAVIDENHVLQVVYPAAEVTRAHGRTLEKLIAKAKARDGIKTYNVMTGCVMREIEGELVITSNPALTAVA
ncbi:hypothetical protein pEaSNUABM29_00045 [Erwinia phage pEa_SNUABM_29]|nr:hypothetical protein pEaSNUABM29_00045 [Erwinia phage pEa_SNUABM_29]